MATRKTHNPAYLARKNERRKRRSKELINEGADIGTLPPVFDLERREGCRLDLHRFLCEYFPETTGLSPFGPAQIRAIKRIESAILDGGRFLNVFPRGFSKTTIGENSIIWAKLYGHRLFTLFVGATAGDAKNAIDSIQTELTENDILHEDFPEVTVAIRHLEGKAQRAASQSFRPGNVAGNPNDLEVAGQTHIAWRSDEIILPHILVPTGWGMPDAEMDWDNLAPSNAAGAVIKSRGITGASRGLKHKTPEGRNIRPSLVILDDPQTDESAQSPTQVDKRLEILEKSLMRLGSHSQPCSITVNATCICDGDMVGRLADQEEFPSFEVEKIKAVPIMPPEEVMETHWLGEYKSLRHGFNRSVPGDRHNAYRRATEYYIAHRDVMDAGTEVAWEDMPLEVGEVSALQHCLNVLVDDGESVFLSELQNEPRKVRSAAASILSAEEYAQRVNGYGHRVVPPGCNHIVGHIDVHDNVLYWVVAGVSDTFCGHVIDYGTFPEQTQRNFNQATVKKTLQGKYKLSVEESIQHGIMDLADSICTTTWADTSGTIYPVSRLLIDIGWAPDQVRYVLRNSDHKNVLAGVKGKGFGPDVKPMTEYDVSPKKIKRCGPDPRAPRWIAPANSPELTLLADTNFWKDTLMARFATPSSKSTNSTSGAWYLYGNHRDVAKHRHIARHIVSEHPVVAASNGRTLNMWKNPSGGQNHWFDNLVGCCVAASYDGCHLPGFQPEPPTKPKRRITINELRNRGRNK